MANANREIRDLKARGGLQSRVPSTLNPIPAGAVAASEDEPRRPNHLGGEPPQAARGARGHIKLTSSWWPMSCGIVKPPYIQPCSCFQGRRPRSPPRLHEQANASWRRTQVAFQVCLELALLPGSGRAQGSFQAGREPP